MDVLGRIRRLERAVRAKYTDEIHLVFLDEGEDYDPSKLPSTVTDETIVLVFEDDYGAGGQHENIFS